MTAKIYIQLDETPGSRRPDRCKHHGLDVGVRGDGSTQIEVCPCLSVSFPQATGSSEVLEAIRTEDTTPTDALVMLGIGFGTSLATQLTGGGELA